MVRNPGVVNWTLILGTHHWNFPPWQRRPWCVPEPGIFRTRRHPWMFMYPRGEAGQWSEATLNNSQKGLNDFQSSAKLPPVLASGRGIQKRFGIKLQHCLQESHLCKRNFYSNSIQSSNLSRLGLYACLERRYVATLEVLCSSEHSCRVLYMKGTSGILKFLKAPFRNWKIHTHLISNWAPTLGTWVMYCSYLGHCH